MPNSQRLGVGSQDQKTRQEPKWRRALRLPREELRILFRAWTLLLFFDLSLRLLPFNTVRRWAQSSSPSSRGSRSPAAVERMRRLVAAAGRNHLYPMTCLRQSLVLQRMLGRRGVQTELRLGVRKEEGRLQAHAWLEIDGAPLGGRLADASRYSAMDEPKG